MAEIHAGDTIYGMDGSPVTVLAESEVFLDKRCYRVGFSDGSSIVASEDHLWTTRHRFRPWAARATYSSGKPRGNGRYGREVSSDVTTAQIAASLAVPRADGGFEANHKIGIASALESADIDLPIPPYVLGAWLGDGTSACAAFTCGDDDLEHMRSELERELSAPMTVSRCADRAVTIRASWTGLQSKLREIGVLENKHIPVAYLDAGTSQRWALLQGLMDTDGTVSRHAGKTTPRCSFTNCNEGLARGVWRLARSLGLKATCIEKDATLNGAVVGRVWHVAFAASQSSQVFRMARKQALLPANLGKRSGTLTIVSCDEVAPVPTKCLGVDS